MGPEQLADAFLAWVTQVGILPRVTEGQVRDLSAAFAAGYLLAVTELGLEESLGSTAPGPPDLGGNSGP